MRHEIVTADFSKFGHREIGIASNLLSKYASRELTEKADKYFDHSKVSVMFNLQSGYVFLSNEGYQTLMTDSESEDKLNLFHSCPNCGSEGFDHEIGFDYEEFVCEECLSDERKQAIATEGIQKSIEAGELNTISHATMIAEDILENCLPFLEETSQGLKEEVEDSLKAFRKSREQLKERENEYQDASTEEDKTLAKRNLKNAQDNEMEAQVNLDELLNESVFDHFNEIAPDGYYFGSHPGDGSDFGFWLAEKEL